VRVSLLDLNAPDVAAGCLMLDAAAGCIAAVAAAHFVDLNK